MVIGKEVPLLTKQQELESRTKILTDAHQQAEDFFLILNSVAIERRNGSEENVKC